MMQENQKYVRNESIYFRTFSDVLRSFRTLLLEKATINDISPLNERIRDVMEMYSKENVKFSELSIAFDGVM